MTGDMPITYRFDEDTMLLYKPQDYHVLGLNIERYLGSEVHFEFDDSRRYDLYLRIGGF